MKELPEWFAEPAEKLGVSVEGWRSIGPSNVAVEVRANLVRVGVSERGEVYMKGGYGSLAVCSYDTLPDAFRLADRLRRALAGEPDPRVAELEAEVERLKTEVQELKEYKHIWHDPQLHHYNLLHCPVLSDAQLRHLLGDDGGNS